MSIIVLGGCGKMGQFMVSDLVKSSVDVTIADINEVVGNKLADQLGTRASFRKINIKEYDNLVESLKDYKLVVNNIGPYFQWSDWVPRAAISWKEESVKKGIGQE